MWGSHTNPNYSYPQQQQPMLQQNNSRIPLNPGVALLGLVGQNTIQQNQASYGSYNYQQPQPQYAQAQPRGYGQQMGYQQQNWGNYQMTRYALNKMDLDQYIPTIFQRWDSNRNGSIEMHEFPGMCMELFKCMNMPPPSQNDMWYLMWRFDQDRNGQIDYNEWANMVYTLGGLKK